MGDSNDLTRRALSAASTASRLTSLKPGILQTFAAVGLDHPHRLESFLDHAHDIGLMQTHFVSRLFYRFLEAADEQQQERRHGHRDQRKVPIEPEHEAEDPDDGQEIDQQAQSVRGREILDGGDVAGDRGQQRAGLLFIEIRQREALQVIVNADAQVVRHPLTHAFGVVVIDVAGDRTHRRDQHHADPRQQRQSHFAIADRQVPQAAQPIRQRVRT